MITECEDCKIQTTAEPQKLTNGDLIRMGLLTDKQMFEIWVQLGRSSQEWFNWLREEADHETLHDSEP